MSLLFLPTARETSETWVYCLFPQCWRLCGFLCGFMGGTVLSHVCRCRGSEVNSVLLYMCKRTWVCVCVSWLCPLEFPVNPDSTHLIATHHIVTPSPRYGTQSANPFPFTLPSSLSEYFLLLLNAHVLFFIFLFFCRRLHFIGTILLRGCFSKGHKLVIIQSWKSLLDQWILLPQSLSFILDFFS